MPNNPPAPSGKEPKEPETFSIIPHIASLLAREVESHSLREVAAEVGVSHGTIHRVINGAAPDVFTFPEAGQALRFGRKRCPRKLGEAFRVPATPHFVFHALATGRF